MSDRKSIGHKSVKQILDQGSARLAALDKAAEEDIKSAVAHAQALAQATSDVSTEAEAQVIERNRRVQQRLAQLQLAIDQFSSMSESWAEIARTVDEAMKEFGDLDNFFSVLQTEAAQLAADISKAVGDEHSRH